MNKQPGQQPLRSLSLTSAAKSPEEVEPEQDSKKGEPRAKAAGFGGGGGGGKRLPEARSTPMVIPNQVAAMPVQMTGFVQLVANNILSAIAHTNSVMVVQCIKPLEIFTGFETPNRYVVHDMYCRPLLYCMERSNIFARQYEGNDRNFGMQIMDTHGAQVMTCFRGRPCCSTDDFLSTQFLDQQIGMMKKECCNPNFELVGSGCNQPLLIQSPGCAGCGGTQKFPVMTFNGVLVGEIVRLYPGFMQEMFTDADTYIVHFPMDMPPILKLLLVTSVFLIDFTYFEDRNQDQHRNGGMHSGMHSSF
ncbi:Phospholipid scramblase [Caenorhabditis elegans]|uniref:Phospholipid scramblase n=1 Tax=Caenorhabditis elegans TaxID=6239 RepID=Q21318_CAEEL|nr:Phospholipid scramblase [Caenorhabditis elegans]CCD72718.1 Phospholipid scramblase [Caenorhabditis elegans]|eukprot:NP_500500.1 Phospholipid scramblase [Caenorhabditis elegans]